MNKIKNTDIEDESHIASDNDIPPFEESKEVVDKSRLSNVRVSKTKRNIALTLFGLFLLITSLIAFGPQMIVQFSIFLDRVKNSQEEVDSEDKAVYIAPPLLTKTFSATTSAKITIRGKSESDQLIEFYRNNSLIEKKQLSKTGNFIFTQVTLVEGENIFRSKAIKGKSESNLSNPLKIIYREKPPEISIANPQDGDAFTGEQSILKISGTTASYAKVKVNDTQAIMNNDGDFQQNFIMQSGENILRISAVDEAGNKTEKEIKISYSP